MKIKNPLPRRERGQSFTELAISLVFLLVLFSVIVDLGQAFYTLNTLRDVVQETASFASICTDTDIIRRRFVSSASEATSVDLDELKNSLKICYFNPTVGPTCITNPKEGHSVKVSIVYKHQVMVPFVSGFIGNNSIYDIPVDVTDTVLQTDKALVREACKQP